jgi:23S rRNA (guanosine2251-2'-O)-methyltransferase
MPGLTAPDCQSPTLMTRTPMPRKIWDPRRQAARSRGPVRQGRPRRQAPSSKARRYPAPDLDRVVLYGWHPVKAALENPNRRIRRLLVTGNALRRLQQDRTRLPVEPEIGGADAFLAYLPADAVHQGVLVEADPLPTPAIEDLDSDGTVLALDQITDPHNVGAILRSAAAFGVSALITTARHSPEATGALAKSASGALEYLPILAIPNLARGLEALKARGFLVVGLDSGAELDLSAAPLRLPLALVLGAEGKGLRQLTRTTCDALAKLALPGRIQSLNVSNAAALALHVASSRLSPQPAGARQG